MFVSNSYQVRLVCLWVCALVWQVDSRQAWPFFEQHYFSPAHMFLESQPMPVYNNYVPSQYGPPAYGSMVARPMAPIAPASKDVDMSSLIPAAIQSRHTIEYKDVPIQSPKLQAQAILVEANALPLTILFRSASSALNIMQQHVAGEGDVQETTSEDEPHILKHSVTKPIIQEVHEIISPFRRVTQEIQPVQEEIQSIVARGMEEPNKSYRPSSMSSYAHSGPTYSMQPKPSSYPQSKAPVTPETSYSNNTTEPTQQKPPPPQDTSSESDSSEESLNLSTEASNSTVLNAAQ